MIQFSGGQAKWNYGENVQYQNINPNRNYQPFLAQQVVNMLLDDVNCYS